jgi:ethanolamine ammonia-lyase large subunit
MMNHLSSITPFLQQSAQELPLDVMYQKMANFENAYDQMVIKGKMVDEAIENNMGEKGTVSNVSFTNFQSIMLEKLFKP